MEGSTRWLSLTLRVALIAVFLWMVKGMVIPVLLGGLVALLLHPLERRLAARLGRFGRFAPSALTIGVIVLVGIPLTVIIIEAIASINRFLARDWGQTADSIQAFLDARMHGLTATFGVSVENVRGYIAQLLQRLGTAVAGAAGALATSLPASVVDVFLFIVALYTLLRDGVPLSKWLRRLSPFQPGQTEQVFASIRETVHGAVLGMLATAVVQGTLTMIALFLFKVPGAFLLGLLATFLSVVPLVGTTPVTVGSAIYLLVVGRYGAAVGMGVAAVLVGLADNVVRPWVVSAQSRMHPLLTLVSIFGGLELFGFSGIFLGPVIAALAAWTVDVYEHPPRKGGGDEAAPPA